MSMVDAVLAAQAEKSKGPGCTVGQLIASRKDGKELTDTLTLAVDGKVQYAVIAQYLTDEWSVEVGTSTLSRHARGGCSCVDD